MKKILPELQVAGFDISKHGLSEARDNIKPYLFRYRAQDRYPFGDQHFDLVISLGTLHNLRLYELESAVQEIERVGKNKYIMVEGYRNELEQFNLECWALTAESSCTPRNGSGSTTISATPATTNSSISSERRRCKSRRPRRRFSPNRASP